MDSQRVPVWLSRSPAEDVKQEKALQVPELWLGAEKQRGGFCAHNPKGRRFICRKGPQDFPSPTSCPKQGQLQDQTWSGFCPVWSWTPSRMEMSVSQPFPVLSWLPASHICWCYFKGTVLGTVIPYLPRVGKVHKSSNDQPGAVIKGPHKNTMLHFCPRVSGCKSLCCCRRNVGFIQVHRGKKYSKTLDAPSLEPFQARAWSILA